jgi:RimJ/RimL family protein N-acetyltransferase
MRIVLRRNGYVKEAHYRQAWPGQDGSRHDGIGYAIHRSDWRSGTTTPVHWDD